MIFKWVYFNIYIIEMTAYKIQRMQILSHKSTISIALKLTGIIAHAGPILTFFTLIRSWITNLIRCSMLTLTSDSLITVKYRHVCNV